MLDTSEYSWPRLGGDPSGAESDGRAWEAGRGAAGSRRDNGRPLSSCGAEGRGQRRDVRVFDFEYLVAAVDSDECGSISESVWECKPDGDRGACDSGDGCEYAGGDYFL